jgi:peptidoglycan glycosyltransferase
VKYAASAAGFHHSMLSPLHGALIMAALGNEGRMMEPYLVDKVEKGGVTIFKAQPRELRRVVAPETATALLDMMALTTKEGTAAKYFRKRDPSLAGISIAGKTGSLSSTDAGVRHHNSWFVAAAPAGAPEIGLAALVVNSGAWHIKGTHLGKAGLEAYFGARKKAAQSASGAPRP